MVLEFNLTVLPWILATVTKCPFDGSRSTMVYFEQRGGILYNFLHPSDLNLVIDAPVGIVRRLVFLRFEKLGPPFYIQLLNESFEILVDTKIVDFHDRSETIIIKSKNQPTLILSLLDICRNLSTTMRRGHIHG